MGFVLWILQFLLAAAFLAHGWMLLAPPASLIDQMNAFMAPWFRIFLGGAEVLAAVGLTLPGMTRVLPWLVPCAAVGIMIVTISATVFHVVRGEVSSAVVTLILLGIATF